MIDILVETGHRAKRCCRLLGVSSPGYHKYKKQPLSPTLMRRQWLTGLIREIHTASRQTYGSRRVHAELTLGMGVKVSERLLAVLMSDAKIVGLPGPTKVKRLHGVATADDLVHRKFRHVPPSIDSAQDTNLVINALDMAIKTRMPPAGGIVHADHGTQFTSWAFTNKILESGLMPSFGTVGDCYENSIMESFWSSMQSYSTGRSGASESI